MNKPLHHSFRSLIALLLWSCVTTTAYCQTSKVSSWKFDFGDGPVMKGYTKVRPTDRYERSRGYGFLGDSLLSVSRKPKNALISDFIAASKPFYFTMDLPEGNYDVKVYAGDTEGTSSVTLRAECRRLMVEPFSTKEGEVAIKEFTVHIRTPRIGATADSVRLKPREKPYLHWDGQLTLEFNGSNAKVCGLEITRNDAAVTVFLAGNSTVVDQPEEPYAAWGQMIPAFFRSHAVVVANYAESGETLKAFEGENRLKKVLSQMKKGDYLFIEFTHNDQKPGANHLDAFTTYMDKLKDYIAQVRTKGGVPVLVTSMHRRNFDAEGKIVNTLADYPEAARRTGAEMNVAVIDLNAMSKVLYESWGVDRSISAFVHYPAGTFPGQKNELKDNTHFSPYGAYQLAKCVAQGIRESNLPLAKFLKKELLPFDPAKPDPIESWYWPLSPSISVVKPDGN